MIYTISTDPLIRNFKRIRVFKQSSTLLKSINNYNFSITISQTRRSMESFIYPNNYLNTKHVHNNMFILLSMFCNCNWRCRIYSFPSENACNICFMSIINRKLYLPFNVFVISFYNGDIKTKVRKFGLREEYHTGALLLFENMINSAMYFSFYSEILH